MKIKKTITGLIAGISLLVPSILSVQAATIKSSDTSVATTANTNLNSQNKLTTASKT
ncbi:hypothetical protein [Pediococcus argentinicus]|uniref:Uncharacterized protein n=1 Tax=Pediococcus argentinicus TaxID=480391 RepID=A0A0R2NJJ7_9LACO|nr:hypothetical protein [Pediococcus argentinicus]KRO25966.1 hypothetical protein IV88_GL001234 [Pediococcus argentinicus]NKZ21784.1 hypothetical protein [Pediococcus argentinicus]GEP18957.1 hypothetical protein LSA03_03410 [Pediococcus argentinicus]